jgi:TolB-like protein/DNA-binding winged helix-turn-helix (wHTH) protein/Tfp pilus assembly protein PilF
VAEYATFKIIALWSSNERVELGRSRWAMPMPHEIIRFQDFELDPNSFELRRAGHLVKLERIPLQLLFLLAENRDRLVPREEILQAIWGKDVFVDADNSINTAVRKARQALKDDPENPSFVRTIPGKGYRFTAQISPPTTPSPPKASEPPERPPNFTQFSPRSRQWAVWAAVALVVIVSTGFILRSRLTRPDKTVPRRSMLVVLPFVNLSGDPREEYFADGMTEEMITQLGSLDPQHLGVIARTSSMRYKGANTPVSQIAQELGINYLLEGSVRQSNGRVRVTAQLIQTSDQTHLWADSFERDLNDILRLQTDVARAIATKIQVALSQQVEARLSRTLTVNPEAYEAYLRGLQAWNLRTKGGFERSIVEFNEAIKRDPNYAPAYVGLARSYSVAPIFGVSTASEMMPKARDVAKRALAMDDSVAEAHTTLAFVQAHYEYDWPTSEREYLRAIEVNPSDAYAHFFYSNSYLSPLAQHNAAMAEMKKAIDLDPFSVPIQSFAGLTYMLARRYDEALAQFQKANQMNPTFALNHQRLARYYMCVGKFDDAIREGTNARLLAGEDAKTVVMKEETLQKALTAGGPRGYWEKLLELSQMKENPPEGFATSYGLARIYAQLGENEKALQSLEKAYEEREIPLTEIGVEPALDPLRSNSRFQSLVRRMGLMP